MTAWLFETERLAVRPKTLADADALHAVHGLATPEQSRDLLAAHIRHQETHGFSMWALVEREGGTVVGDVGFLLCEDGVEIGWHVRPDARGRGYATEAAAAALRYGFDRLGFTRVSAFTETANAASLRVIAKLGMRFVREGAGGVPAWAEYAVP